MVKHVIFFVYELKVSACHVKPNGMQWGQHFICLFYISIESMYLAHDCEVEIIYFHILYCCHPGSNKMYFTPQLKTDYDITILRATQIYLHETIANVENC